MYPVVTNSYSSKRYRKDLVDQICAWLDINTTLKYTLTKQFNRNSFKLTRENTSILFSKEESTDF